MNQSIFWTTWSSKYIQWHQTECCLPLRAGKVLQLCPLYYSFPKASLEAGGVVFFIFNILMVQSRTLQISSFWNSWMVHRSIYAISLHAISNAIIPVLQGWTAGNHYGHLACLQLWGCNQNWCMFLQRHQLVYGFNEVGGGVGWKNWGLLSLKQVPFSL